MTTRWLAAVAVVAALAGCAGEKEPDPAIVPVAPGVSSPAAVSPGLSGSASPGDAASPGTTGDAAADGAPAADGGAPDTGGTGPAGAGGNAAQLGDADGNSESEGKAGTVLESAEGTAARGRTHAELERAQAGGINAFVAAVRREFPALLIDHRDEEIAAIADRACGSLGQGRASNDVVAQAGTDVPGVDDATARRLVELAVKTVCPDLDRSLGS